MVLHCLWCKLVLSCYGFIVFKRKCWACTWVLFFFSSSFNHIMKSTAGVPDFSRVVDSEVGTIWVARSSIQKLVILLLCILLCDHIVSPFFLPSYVAFKRLVSSCSLGYLPGKRMSLLLSVLLLMFEVRAHPSLSFPLPYLIHIGPNSPFFYCLELLALLLFRGNPKCCSTLFVSHR